jgi:hypothetical protein
LLVLGHCGFSIEKKVFECAPQRVPGKKCRVREPQRAAAASGADERVKTAFAAATVVITFHLLTDPGDSGDPVWIPA